MRFFLGINPDQTLRVRALMQSDDKRDRAHFQTTVQPGQQVFGFSYDVLKQLAQTQGYIDYEMAESTPTVVA
jgi:hypothetical protein